ncbi:MAG: hypothetical protein ACYC1M_00920 [Armatimonadota bacterium]
MIVNIKLLHYLSKSTYKRICERLSLNSGDNIIGNNFVEYPGGVITKVHLFNINYKSFGRIWFMRVDVDFRLLSCSNEQFPEALRTACMGLFGKEAMDDYPAYDQINCDYVEYTAIADVGNADEAIKRLLQGKCSADQLDRDRWANYQKPHSTIALYICKEDDKHLSLLAKCHGTAMKRRIKTASLHRATGIMPSVAVNAQTEQSVFEFLWQQYITPSGFDDINLTY